MNNKTNVAGKIFSETFAKIKTSFEFKPGYHNGTGYFNELVHYSLETGALAKTEDERGRRIILIGTRFGCVVVFDRNEGQTEGGIYASNYPNEIIFNYIIGKARIDDDTMPVILGHKNIGQIIESIAKEFKKTKVVREVIETPEQHRLDSDKEFKLTALCKPNAVVCEVAAPSLEAWMGIEESGIPTIDRTATDGHYGWDSEECKYRMIRSFKEEARDYIQALIKNELSEYRYAISEFDNRANSKFFQLYAEDDEAVAMFYEHLDKDPENFAKYIA